MKSSSRSAFANHLLVYTMLAIGFTGSIGVGTVWMQHQISLVANANKAIETRIKAVERQYEQATTEIAEEQDGAVLLERNAAWNLGLVPPAPGQIQSLSERPENHLLAKGNRELFAGAISPVSIRLALQR